MTSRIIEEVVDFCGAEKKNLTNILLSSIKVFKSIIVVL